MKKGLSILLVAAALFGFYGSAVNLNDILACKDYWEEAGEKTTADMNKLEDGLNQLKENEEAYLDGQDQLAEGEKTLADGEAQYAKGLADYAAAPGKLAAARKKIAKGEKDLSSGKGDLDGLKKLIAVIKKIRTNYAKWKAGYDALHENRQKLVAGLDKVADPEAGATVKQVLLGSVAPQLEGAQSAFESAVNGINDKNQFADGYKKFAANGRTVAAGVTALIAKLEESKEGAEGIVAACSTKPDLSPDYMITLALKNPETKAKTEAGIKAVLALTPYGAQADQLIALAAAGNATGIGNIKAAAQGVASTLGDKVSGLKALQSAYTSNLIAYADAVDENIATLDDGQSQLSDGVATVASTVLSKKALKSGVKKAFGKKAIALLQTYSSTKGPLSTDVASFEFFETQMDKDPGIDAFLKKAQSLLAKTRAKGLKTYSAGKKKLAAGKAQYAQGLRDYAAAPGKLADAEEQLADGRQQLADGKAKLQEYEDGEQQIRDGLATLVGTEPDLTLESIANRLNGDTDFDNGDEHLDIDEGLAAVDVGRGYQADDGVLITDEIMARAVGTGALIGAGALAIIAAILSFLKKNKGAGVFAILAAAAGAFGAYYGTNAGTYFSDIAGSTAGNAAWMAAGILGAIALVHAIVHFTAKKEA